MQRIRAKQAIVIPISLVALFFYLYRLPCLAATSKTSAPSATLQGIITDQLTGNPIAKARVRIYSIAGDTVADTSTDNRGSYSVNIDFYGLYFIHVSAKDYKPASSKCFLRGQSYTVDLSLVPLNPKNAPLRINSLTPPDNSVFLAGARITLQAEAQDPQNSPLEYRFSIGGTVVQDWAKSHTYTWQTSSADTGLISLTYEVRNGQNQKASRTISCRILNPSVEDILKKVADNYAKIQDFKADMTLSSTLDAKPFGETEYCRYYFQAPNKEKTVSYTDSTRANLKEITITNGSTLYLIDPVNKLTQEVDLLQETGLTSAQFNQMDLYYNQSNFLTKHIVTKNNPKADFNSFIIALDAIPKEKNNLYSKIELYVDYNKGLMVKIIHYKDDELPQAMEVIESKQMANGAWLVSKLKKIPNLTAGNLTPLLTYDNIQLNSGLTDSDFDPNRQY